MIYFVSFVAITLLFIFIYWVYFRNRRSHVEERPAASTSRSTGRHHTKPRVRFVQPKTTAIFIPSKHTVSSYRSQQRAAAKKRKSKS